MKNSEILVKSILDWINPITKKAMENISNGNTVFSFVNRLIDPDWLSESVVNHLGMPYIRKAIERLPEESIPKFSMEILDGMIQKRVKDGGLVIEALGLIIEPDAFKNLKSICEANFNQYAEGDEWPPRTGNTGVKPVVENLGEHTGSPLQERDGSVKRL